MNAPATLHRDHERAASYCGLRVNGTLAEDARLYSGTGWEPKLWLHIHLQPEHGLPYTGRVDLGDDLADHMAAEALLPQMRTGAVVSVAAHGVQMRTQHGKAVLQLLHPFSVVLYGDPRPATPPAPPAAAQLHLVGDQPAHG